MPHATDGIGYVADGKRNACCYTLCETSGKRAIHAAMRQQPTILVINDDEDIRVFVCRLFTPAGYRVSEAATGLIVVRVRAQTHPCNH